jgi:hypothetical protein
VAEPPIPRSSVELGIVCQEFVELVTEHLEGTLPEAVERVVAEQTQPGVAPAARRLRYKRLVRGRNTAARAAFGECSRSPVTAFSRNRVADAGGSRRPPGCRPSRCRRR